MVSLKCECTSTKSDARLTYGLAVGLRQVNPYPGRRASVKYEAQGSEDCLALFRGEGTWPLYTLLVLFLARDPVSLVC